MFPQILLPNAEKLKIEKIGVEAGVIHIEVASVQDGCGCPTCGEVSQQIHSRYTRHLADLPRAGMQVKLHLAVRKYFCRVPSCAQRIFTERLAGITQPYARRTTRLADVVTDLGLAVGGAMGKRISQRLGFPSSVGVLLSHVRKLVPPSAGQIEVLGIDDWAIRRGQRYGTVLVDMQTSRPVDLLPSRETRYVAGWLRTHPEVRVVSRDRATGYAEAVRQGAPQAVQVADRWHLLKNLSDVLSLCYEKHRQMLKQVLVEADGQSTRLSPRPEEAALLTPLLHTSKRVKAPRPLSPIEQLRAQRHAHWQAKLEEVHRLREEGLSIGAITRQSGLTRRTVKKYLALDSYPRKTAPKFGSRIMDAYKSYVQQRVAEGMLSCRTVWHELRDQGFTGSITTVYRYILMYRLQTGIAPVPTPLSLPLPTWPVTPRTLAALVVCRPEALSDKQHQLIAHCCELHPTLATITQLAQDFTALLRAHAVERLSDWMQRVLHSPFEPLKTFVGGIQRDQQAVAAAVTSPLSNSRVEGHVNRIKFIKRQMFGRAKFDLLRIRVLLFR